MNSVELWQVICLALIQGITEFLPISSAAHLQLPTLLLEWPDQGLPFDVATHGGSLFAVIWYYRIKLVSMVQGSIRSIQTRQSNSESDYLVKLIIATLPVVIAGLVFRDFVEQHARDLEVIVATTLLFGLLLGAAEIHHRRLQRFAETRVSTTFPMRYALYIGCAQIFALIPGTSRSGVTITCALFLGVSRIESARFAFLLGIPAIAGAVVLMVPSALSNSSQLELIALALAFFSSALATYVCIDLFLRFIEKVGLMPFVIYRLFLAAILMVFIWA